MILLWALCCTPLLAQQQEPPQPPAQQPSDQTTPDAAPPAQPPEQAAEKSSKKAEKKADKKADKKAAKKADKPKKTDAASDKHLTPAERVAFFRTAQVWTPTDIPAMDLKAGPTGSDAFQPNEIVTCDYVPATLSGKSRKFDCKLADGDVVKVRYGKDNGEVEGSVLATRLLWALGFGADRMYPVRVTCRGCSDDPWKKPKKVEGQHMFDPATIERKASGTELEGDKPGWAWPELDLVDETAGGAPKAQRDGLELLAVMLQHTDNKAEQQVLLCLPGGLKKGSAECARPFLLVHDLGLTFGHANLFNSNDQGSVNFNGWSTTPIWKDARKCEGHLSKSASGTLGNPIISEAGRQFLAGLLVQLSDAQLHDLFDVARVDQRSRKPGSKKPPASTDEWVAAFKQKRDAIVANHCK
jgi:hypothetical protein